MFELPHEPAHNTQILLITLAIYSYVVNLLIITVILYENYIHLPALVSISC